MKDSRFIASGAYGCIYHPPYDCKGKDLKDTSFVTKLVKNDYTSQTEYDISTMLKNKDGFLLIEKKCDVSSQNIKKFILLHFKIQSCRLNRTWINSTIELRSMITTITTHLHLQHK